MRLLISCALLFGLLTTACESRDSAPLYVDLSYQVRCLSCEDRAPDSPAREIMLIAGEQGYRTECRVSRVAGKREFTLSLSYRDPERPSDNHDFRINQAVLDGNDLGRDCQVRVIETSNTYVGGCTKDEPSEATPCQLALEVDGDTVKGSVWCRELPNPANLMTRRQVVAPGTTNPAPFEVVGCSGL